MSFLEYFYDKRAARQHKICSSDSKQELTSDTLKTPLNSKLLFSGVLAGVVIVAYVRNRCFPEDKLYEYTLDEPPQPHSNGGPNYERDNLLPHSDSGGFVSFKPEVKAVNNHPQNHQNHSKTEAAEVPYHIKRQSMVKSQEALASMPEMPDIPDGLPNPDDVMNGNAHGYATAGRSKMALPLETTM